eukprot:TRINITY_DN382_c0_g1_i1.p1 TRINITY_DN382_c0_g1~~TRINITY_DN382_c0_g1_i1.p1  ORF type:complete len:2287 (-),score=719.67 TRINITY_DN382_c0_g1_i1:49-6909(-)
MAGFAWGPCMLVLALLCVHVGAIERFGNGVAQVDTFSMLDNDRVDILKWNALKFGAATVDFREAKVETAVDLNLPGVVFFDSENVALGGAGSGPLAVNSGTHNVDFASSSLSFAAVNGVNMQASGSDIVLYASSSGDLRSQGVVSVSGGQVEVRAEQSVSVVAEASPVTIQSGADGAGRNTVEGDSVLLSAASGITFTTGRDFEAAAGRNLDATGDTVALTGSSGIDVAAPLGDVFVEAGAGLQVFGVSGVLRGDSGVLIQSITSDVTLSSKFDAQMELRAGDAVQVHAVNRGLVLSAVTASLVMTAPDSVVLGTEGDTSVSASDVDVSTQGSATFSATGTGGVSIVQKDELFLNSGSDIIASGLRIEVAAGEFLAEASVAEFYARHELSFEAQEDVESFFANDMRIRHEESARFEAGGELLLESTVGNALFDAGRNLGVSTVNGDGLMEALQGTLVVNGEASSYFEATQGDLTVNTKSGGDAVLQSGDDVYLRSDEGQARLEATDQMTLDAEDDIRLTGGRWTVDSGNFVFGAEENVEFHQTGWSSFYVVEATRITMGTKTALLGPTDSLEFSAGTHTKLAGDTLLDFAFDGVVTMESASNIDVGSGADEAWVSAGELLYFAAGELTDVQAKLVVVASRKDTTMSAAKNATFAATRNTALIEGFRGVRATAADDIGWTARTFSASAKGLLAVGAVEGSNTFDVQGRSKFGGELIKFESLGDISMLAPVDAVLVSGDRDWYLLGGSLDVRTGEAGGSVSMGAAEVAALEAVSGIDVTAQRNVDFESANGDDISVLSGDDVLLTAAQDLTATGKEVTISFVESGVVKAVGNISVVADTYQYMKAEEDFTNRALKEVSLIGSDVDIVATEKVEVTGGFIRLTSIEGGTDPSITIEADGGGQRWKTARFPDKDPQPYGDILMRGGEDMILSAGRNLSLWTFDGYWKGESEGTGGVRGGIVTFTSGGEKHIRFDGEGAPGVFLGTRNQENAHVYGGNVTEIFTATSALLRSFGRDDISGAGTHFEADNGGDFCYLTDTSNDGLLIDGYRGVTIRASGGGADVFVSSAKGTTVDAERTLEIRSDGWSDDPLGINGLGIPLGVLFRTNAENTRTGLGEGDIVVESSADVLMHGLEGATFNARAGIVEVFGSDEVDLRSTDYLANVNVLAEGDVDVQAARRVFVRAGSSSSDGDLRLNATRTASIDALQGDISWVQLGSSADSVRSGAFFSGEKGHVRLDADGELSFDAATGNGRIDVNAETGDFSVTAGDDVEITAVKAQVLIQGQTSANFKASGDAQVVSAEELEFSSGGNSDVEVEATTFTATADEFFGLSTLNDIELRYSSVDVTADFFRAAAGGSLTLSANEGDLSVSATKAVEIIGDSEVNVDTDLLNWLAERDGIAVSLGGDKATTGLDIDSVGNIDAIAEDVIHLAGDFTEVKAGMDLLIRGSDTTFDARGEFGRGLLMQSDEGVVAFSAKETVLRSDEETLIQANSGDLVVSASGVEFISLRDMALIAPQNPPPESRGISMSAGDALTHTHFDMNVVASESYKLIGLTVPLRVQADAKLSVEVTDRLDFKSITGSILLNSTQDDATVLFETQGSQSDIELFSGGNSFAHAAQGIDIDGQDGVVLDAGHRIDLNATDVVVLESGGDVLLEAFFQVTLDSRAQMSIASGAEIDLYAPNGDITLTAIDTVAMNADGDISFEFADLSGAAQIVAPAGDVLISSGTEVAVSALLEIGVVADAIHIQSTGGQPGDVTDNGGVLFEAATIEVTSTAGALDVRGDGGVTVSSVLGSAFTSEAQDLVVRGGGAGGVSIAAPTGDLNADLTFTSTAGSIISNAGDETLLQTFGDATPKIQVTSPAGELLLESSAPEGDIYVGAMSPDTTVGTVSVIGTFTEFVAQHDHTSTSHGVVELKSEQQMDFLAQNQLFLASGANVDFVSNVFTATAAGTSPLLVEARNQVELRHSSMDIDTSNMRLFALADQGLIEFAAPDISVGTTGAGFALEDAQDIEIKSASTLGFSGTALTLGAQDAAADVSVDVSAFEGSVTMSTANSIVLGNDPADRVVLDSGNRGLVTALTVLVESEAEVLIAGGERVVFESQSTATPSGFDFTQFVDFVEVTSLNSLYMRAEEGISLAADTAHVFTTRDVLVRALEGTVNVGSDMTPGVSINAQHNLGPIGGLIHAREYNPNGAEFVVFNGGLTITAATKIELHSADSITFGSERLICYDTDGGNIGWFGRSGTITEVPEITASDICLEEGAPQTCEQLTTFVSSIQDALLEYNLIRLQNP